MEFEVVSEKEVMEGPVKKDGLDYIDINEDDWEKIEKVDIRGGLKIKDVNKEIAELEEMNSYITTLACKLCGRFYYPKEEGTESFCGSCLKDKEEHNMKSVNKKIVKRRFERLVRGGIP